MRIKVVLKYIHGSFTIIELNRDDEKKIIVFDCGSYSCNWGCEHFQNPSSIPLPSNLRRFEAKFWNETRELPLSGCGFDVIVENKLIEGFKRLNELKPDVIIISHPDRDHYNCVPLLNLEHLEKVICYRDDFLEKCLKNKVDVLPLSGVGTFCLKDLLDNPIYEAINIHVVESDSNSPNDSGLICVVGGENGSIFMPGDVSPKYWTDAAINEMNKCVYNVLPHHGDRRIENRSGNNRLLPVDKKNITLIANVGKKLHESQTGLIRQISGDENITIKLDDETKDRISVKYLEKYVDENKNEYIPLQIDL